MNRSRKPPARILAQPMGSSVVDRSGHLGSATGIRATLLLRAAAVVSGSDRGPR